MIFERLCWDKIENITLSICFSGADTETILLIVGITFLIVAIIVGIGVAFYIRRWKKKKDLELLGKGEE